jgi:hypothetical protein
MVLDTVISFVLTPPPVDDMVERIAATLPMYLYLVAELDGGVVGNESNLDCCLQRSVLMRCTIQEPSCLVFARNCDKNIKNFSGIKTLKINGLIITNC